MRGSTASAAASQTQREIEAASRREVPFVRELEVRDLGRERVRIGETRALVLGREARDAAGLGDRLAQRLRAQVGGARGALARAEIDRDAHAAVALVLDRLDLTHAHRHRQPDVHAHAGLGLVAPSVRASARASSTSASRSEPSATITSVRCEVMPFHPARKRRILAAHGAPAPRASIADG